MSKKIGVVGVLVGICALSLFLISCGSSSSRPSGVLYVLTQGSNGIGSNVSSFAVDLNSGNLSLINSNASTCASGATCGSPLDILLDPTGATAFVLGQSAISSYTVNSDGSFGSPATAYTVTPNDTALAMARDAAGSFLYVITTGNQNVTPILPPQLLVFSTKPGSTTLTAAGVSNLTHNPTALSTITFPVPNGVINAPCGATTNEEYVFVSSNHDLTAQHNDNALSVYCVDSSGNLSDLTPDPPYTPDIDPLSVVAINTNPPGQNSGGVFVYTGSQPGSGGGAMSGFQMCIAVGSNCSSQDVGGALLKPVTCNQTSCGTQTGQNPVAMVVDPTNNFLYVVCQIQSAVYGYRINTTSGTLSSQTPASQPTGSQPVALALHPSVGSTGQFLYTSNSVASNISGFTLNTTTGTMSSPITITSPSTPSGIAVR